MESERKLVALEAIANAKAKQTQAGIAILTAKYINIEAERYSLPYKVVCDLYKAGTEVLPNEYYPAPHAPNELASLEAKAMLYELKYDFKAERENREQALNGCTPEQAKLIREVSLFLMPANDEVEGEYKSLQAKIEALRLEYPAKSFKIGSQEWRYYFAHFLIGYKLDEFTERAYIGSRELVPEEYKAFVQACRKLQRDVLKRPADFFTGENPASRYEDTHKGVDYFYRMYAEQYEKEQADLWRKGDTKSLPVIIDL